MPYTKITEVDNTTVSSISARESHAVYIPGFATLPDFNTYNEPIYLQSISDLHKLEFQVPFLHLLIISGIISLFHSGIRSYTSYPPKWP